MDIKHLMEYYKPRHLTPEQLKEHVKLHVDIEIDVNLVRDKIGYYEENYNHNKGNIDALVEAIDCMINVPQNNVNTRTRQDLINLIAALEHIAGNYRDEIADGAYNEEGEGGLYNEFPGARAL